MMAITTVAIATTHHQRATCRRPRPNVNSGFSALPPRGLFPLYRGTRKAIPAPDDISHVAASFRREERYLPQAPMRRWIVIAVVVLIALLAAVAAGGWWFIHDRQRISEG